MLMLPSHSSPLVLSILLLLSLPAFLLLVPRFVPHRSDELEDLTLFRRAVLSYSATSAPSLRRQPKVAFLFLTNTDLYFAPLWERFFQNSTELFNIYVHLDPTVQLLNPLTGPFAGRTVPSRPTMRASPSLIAAARRLLAAALLDDPANSYFALLSQSCVPLHSFRFMYETLLSDRRRRSFIEILSGEPQLWDRYIARGDDVMLPEVSFSQFRVGSQFFILSRQHARLVVRDRKLWKKFRLPCLESMQDSCYPEEHYFPTLLNMRDPHGCSGYTLTRVNWTSSVGGHPHTYRPAEISVQMIQDLRKSNSSYSYLFARKFAPECLDPLMEIADDVIFRD